jgi:Copper type II ascorbate-dependent monooxygenase, C-terminal domain.
MYLCSIAAGKVVSGYHIRTDGNGVDQWTLLGKRNPLTPQMFYPVENQAPIVHGDKLVRSIYSTVSCVT